jgi:acetate kinase
LDARDWSSGRLKRADKSATLNSALDRLPLLKTSTNTETLKILALNCGSSSLKFQVFETDSDAPKTNLPKCLVQGKVKLGLTRSMGVRTDHGDCADQNLRAASHGEAIHSIFHWLDGQDDLRTTSLDAVGHRVVHGGDEFNDPMLIDKAVMQSLQGLHDLAPLHNGPALEAIREARTLLGDAIPMVAVFDTAFHKTLPDWARRYAIAEELTIKHRLWRFGFHGLAHRWMMERYAALAGKAIEATKLITLQLGSGCSVTAIDHGRSIETSMGLTPLEGLMMATCSGDVDPSLPGVLAEREGVSLQQVDEWLNTRSGLLGVCGESDMKEILKAEREGSGRAALALQMFCHRIRKYVGAYLTLLDGADAIVFGGGIGENVPGIRSRVCAGMSWCRLQLDAARNDAAVGVAARISADNSKIQVYVIPVNEEVLIARVLHLFLRGTPQRRSLNRKDAYAVNV